MRILQVCPKYYPSIGGVEEHVRNISEKLAKKHQITTATTDPTGDLPKEEIINGVRVMRFKSWAPSDSYFFSRRLYRYLGINSGDFDVVHAHSYHAFPALYAAQTKTRNKLVFTSHYHGTGHTIFRSLLHRPYEMLGKKIFGKADRVICVSDFEKNLITKKLNVNSEKIAVIPNGLNLEEFGRLLRPKKNYTKILCVGRLEKYKGIQYVVRVMPRMTENTFLEIVGKGHYMGDLIKLASRLHVDRRIMFAQDLSREELLKKYSEADLFVSLSKHEAYGMCVAEALACGTPCVVVGSSALRAWVDNRNCFEVSDPANLEELRHIIEDTIGRNVTGLRFMDWSEIADKTVDLYG
jgi:glycosyltransferase involved in cell wall biosynthesis